VKCKRERFLPRAAVKCVALRLLQVSKTGCREYGTTYLLEQYGSCTPAPSCLHTLQNDTCVHCFTADAACTGTPTCHSSSGGLPSRHIYHHCVLLPEVRLRAGEVHTCSSQRLEGCLRAYTLAWRTSPRIALWLQMNPHGRQSIGYAQPYLRHISSSAVPPPLGTCL
jgi:hypothetical protein